MRNVICVVTSSSEAMVPLGIIRMTCSQVLGSVIAWLFAGGPAHQGL